MDPHKQGQLDNLAAISRSIETLSSIIQETGRTGNRLTKQLVWLNIVLTVLTILMLGVIVYDIWIRVLPAVWG